MVEDVSRKIGQDAVRHAQSPGEVSRDVQRHESVRLEIVPVESIEVFAGDAKQTRRCE